MTATAGIWDARTGRLIMELPPETVLGVCFASFSPEGSRALAVSGSASVWDGLSGELKHLPPPLIRAGRVSYFTGNFSPDGRLLVLSRVYNGAEIRDSSTCELLAQTV